MKCINGSWKIFDTSNIWRIKIFSRGLTVRHDVNYNN